MISHALIKPHSWWQYIDDIFIIWTEGEESLKDFINYLNSAHGTIKFTSKWSYQEVEFLDVKVLNDSGKLETDVYIKPTYSHQYLHRVSCHPNSCKKGIPYAQALRLRRICSKETFFERRVRDLCSFLVERGYEKNFIQEQVSRARKTPRDEALRDRPKKENTSISFTVTYHPGLPNIGGMLRKLHPVLHSSQRCRNAITEVPMVAFRRPKCLSDYLVGAKFRSDAKEEITGTSRCESNFLCVGRTFRSKTNGKDFRINYNLNCNSENVVYLITCKVCGIQYVGSTTTTFRFRFNNHKSRIHAPLKLSSGNKSNDDFLYQHFHSSGHLGLTHLSIQLIDRAKGERELRKKEGQWMYRLETLRPQGLNEDGGFYAQNRKTRVGARKR